MDDGFYNAEAIRRASMASIFSDPGVIPPSTHKGLDTPPHAQLPPHVTSASTSTSPSSATAETGPSFGSGAGVVGRTLGPRVKEPPRKSVFMYPLEGAPDDMHEEFDDLPLPQVPPGQQQPAPAPAPAIVPRPAPPTPIANTAAPTSSSSSSWTSSAATRPSPAVPSPGIAERQKLLGNFNPLTLLPGAGPPSNTVMSGTSGASAGPVGAGGVRDDAAGVGKGYDDGAPEMTHVTRPKVASRNSEGRRPVAVPSFVVAAADDAAVVDVSTKSAAAPASSESLPPSSSSASLSPTFSAGGAVPPKPTRPARASSMSGPAIAAAADEVVPAASAAAKDSEVLAKTLPSPTAESSQAAAGVPPVPHRRTASSASSASSSSFVSSASHSTGIMSPVTPVTEPSSPMSTAPAAADAGATTAAVTPIVTPAPAGSAVTPTSSSTSTSMLAVPSADAVPVPSDVSDNGLQQQQQHQPQPQFLASPPALSAVVTKQPDHGRNDHGHHDEYDDTNFDEYRFDDDEENNEDDDDDDHAYLANAQDQDRVRSMQSKTGAAFELQQQEDMAAVGEDNDNERNLESFLASPSGPATASVLTGAVRSPFNTTAAIATATATTTTIHRTALSPVFQQEQQQRQPVGSMTPARGGQGAVDTSIDLNDSNALLDDDDEDVSELFDHLPAKQTTVQIHRR